MGLGLGLGLGLGFATPTLPLPRTDLLLGHVGADGLHQVGEEEEAEPAALLPEEVGVGNAAGVHRVEDDARLLVEPGLGLRGRVRARVRARVGVRVRVRVRILCVEPWLGSRVGLGFGLK